jgi:hypothetical protein
MAITAFPSTLASTRTITDFRSQLAGGGVRPNLYEVHLEFPTGCVDTSLTVDVVKQSARFFCKSAALPGVNIGVVDVPFRGRSLKVAGDRTFDTWTVTLINDTTYDLRGTMERWANFLSVSDSGQGRTNPADYMVDAHIYQLGRAQPHAAVNGDTLTDNTIPSLRGYKMWGLWPSNVSQIDVAYDSNDTIEEFTAEFQVQWWESDGNGGAAASIN